MIKTIIFDLFGTLVYLRRNSRPYLKLCRAVGGIGRIRHSLIVDATTLSSFCEQIGEELPPQIEEFQRDLDLDVADAALFDDVFAALTMLRSRGIQMGLISNLASPYKKAFFDLGLGELIESPVFSCDVGYQKPGAEVYQIALDVLRAKPESTLMIGDSQRPDVDGPKKFGIQALLLDRSGGSTDETALNNLIEVESHLR